MDAQAQLRTSDRTETLEVLNRFKDSSVLQNLLANTHKVIEAAGLCRSSTATIFISSGGNLRLPNGHKLGSLSLSKDGFVASYSDSDIMGFGGRENDVPVDDATLEFISQHLQIEEAQVVEGIRSFLSSGFGTAGGGFYRVCNSSDNIERVVSDILGTTVHYPELQAQSDPE